jgi:hypothetical protein
VDDLAHVSWQSGNGTVTILDGSTTRVRFRTAARLPSANDISLAYRDRSVDMFQKAGVDLTIESGWVDNLAAGKPVTASFTTSTPALRATAPEFAVDGYTISGLPAQIGTYMARNTIWGTQGSPNPEDWLEVDLTAPTRFNSVKLYFFSDKAYNTQSNGAGNTYREPASYRLQYHNGTDWVDLPNQVRTPEAAQPNYNTVEFSAVTARRLRILATPVSGFGIGVKELQVFNEVRCDRTVTGIRVGTLNVDTGVTGLAENATIIGPVNVRPGASLVATGANLVGPVSTDGAAVVELLGGTVAGPVSIAGTTARVALVEARFVGPLRLTRNGTAGTQLVLAANTVVGPVTCTDNQPTPINHGRYNTVIGPATGQCAGL